MALPAFLTSTCIMWLAASVVWLQFSYGLLPSLALGVVIGTAAFFLIIGLHAVFQRFLGSSANDVVPSDTVASGRR